MEKRLETHKLKCIFTQDELLSLGERNAILQQELDQVKEEKKSATASFASQIKIKEEEIRLTSTQLANKYEHRNVDCEIQFHLPDKGKKTLTRNDTLESWIENMTDVDWNLWNDKYVYEECDVQFHQPVEGKKTFTHKERPELTFVEHMTQADIDETQGKLFNEEEEIESAPQVEEDQVTDVDFEESQEQEEEETF